MFNYFWYKIWLEKWLNWCYYEKFDENNNLVKFKARLVAKGFSQVYGEDYVETFSPVALLQSIRTLTAIAAATGYKIHHMDVGYSRGYFAGITWRLRRVRDGENRGPFMDLNKALANGISFYTII